MQFCESETKNWIDRTLLKSDHNKYGKPYTVNMVKIGTIPKMGRPYSVKVKDSFLTQLRHKVVNLILRKWKVYEL